MLNKEKLQEKLKKLYLDEKLHIDDICKKLEKNKSWVKNNVYKLGLHRKSVFKFNQKLNDSIIYYHQLKYSNRQIAKELKINHRTVGKYLKINKLRSIWDKHEDVYLIDENNAKCTKCNNIYPLNEFQYSRRGQNYHYRYKWCKCCRKKQYHLNINNDKNKFLKYKYNGLKRRCKYNNIYFNITYIEYKSQYYKQKEKCFYSDEKMITLAGNGLQRNSLSVDKIIPEKGYTKNNIVFCTQRINTVKSDFTLDEIKKWMPEWYNRIMKYLTECQVADGDF